MSNKLQLDVRHLNRWWRHLVNAYEVRQAWCLLQAKLCDPCLSALKWFVYHARRYTSAQLYFARLFEGLGTTYDVHLGLIGKRLVDFLLVLIEYCLVKLVLTFQLFF